MLLNHLQSQLIQLNLTHNHSHSHSHSQILNQQFWLKAQLQQPHDQNVDMLRGLGVDPCKAYRIAHVQRVIDNIEPGINQCRFCKKTLRQTQKLKAHIRSFHSRQEALQCQECPMKVGDAYALKVHMHIHTDGGRKYLCNGCGKSYLTASKLNENSKKHVAGCLPCECCNKTFSEEKGLKDHKKVCKLHPGAGEQLKEVTHPHKCSHCYRHFTRGTNL